jgi:hypothetical protein
MKCRGPEAHPNRPRRGNICPTLARGRLPESSRILGLVKENVPSGSGFSTPVFQVGRNELAGERTVIGRPDSGMSERGGILSKRLAHTPWHTPQPNTAGSFAL